MTDMGGSSQEGSEWEEVTFDARQEGQSWQRQNLY